MSVLQKYALLASLALSGCSAPTDSAGDKAMSAYTELAGDESIVLFRTAGWLDEEAQIWHLPVHGWIFEPEDSVVRKQAIARVLEEKYGLQADEASETVFSSRVNWLIADNERGKTVVVRLGEHEFELPPSSPNGHFEHLIEMPVAHVEEISVNGVVPVSVVTRELELRSFNGRIKLVANTGLSVISDIDDTIKVSRVTDRRQLLEYTLFREFEAAPGMAKRYAAWGKQGAVVHFVSSSPWQLYPQLAQFADEAGFPSASFHLKAFRFRDETLLNLFKEGAETKPAQIEPILQAWPQREFVLVGDSGEQDPEVYAELARRYPERIRRVYIRNVTAASPDDARFSSVFDGIERDRWALFTDPAGLSLP